MAARARARHAGLMAGVIAAFVVGMAFAVLLSEVVRAAPDPRPHRAAPPASGPAAAARPSAYTRMMPVDSRLYNVALPHDSASCPEVARSRPPVPDADLVRHLRSIASCLTRLNQSALAEQGIRADPPRVIGFVGEVRTGCGVLTQHAFYCADDKTIYVDVRSDDDTRFYADHDLGYWMVISHELGHHFQLLGGITHGLVELRTADPDSRRDVSRRSELQATCFSGVSMAAVWRGIGGTPAAYQAWLSHFTRANDAVTGEGTHGSGAAQYTWFSAGFEDVRGYGACNTWIAPPGAVE